MMSLSNIQQRCTKRRLTLQFTFLVLRFCFISILQLYKIESSAVAFGTINFTENIILDNNEQNNNDLQNISQNSTFSTRTNTVMKREQRILQSDNGTIYGGKPPIPGKYPFIAAFRFISYTIANYTACSGTLIRHDMVLTSAQCIRDWIRQFNYKLVYIGGDETYTGTPYIIAKTFIHPAFNNDTRVNDIGLVKLKCSSNAATIKLNFEKRIPVTGTQVTVAGYGLVPNSSLTTSLMETDLNVYSDNYCAIKHIYEVFPYIPTRKMCAGREKDGFGVCYFDEGGPLIMFNKKYPRRSIQVGVTSGGEYRCGREQYPSLFTRVATYRGFINDIIRRFSSNSTVVC
jgi:secreted trypsin-like serine protease